MTQKEKRLQDIVSLTNSELSRADAKFRNIGAINTLLIGTFVSIILFMTKYYLIQTGMKNLGIYIPVVSVVSFFILIQIIAISFSIYGVWPRERYTHNPYDIRFISSKTNMRNLKETSFSEKKSIQMIAINSKMIVRKRRIAKIVFALTIFPISLILLTIIRKQDKAKKSSFSKTDKKYLEALGIDKK